MFSMEGLSNEIILSNEIVNYVRCIGDKVSRSTMPNSTTKRILYRPGIAFLEMNACLIAIWIDIVELNPLQLLQLQKTHLHWDVGHEPRHELRARGLCQ